ncbi:hypothetical protein conserved [Leishmania donovani]|uniref:Hypothetical_protein_conserved n=1 Tax=Leishmania donovani TaxID=5661 RepID=A0A504XGI1_LEIDO|nr:hypothetical protein CGC20_0235 [Leishmania donovani]CAJ1992970.1 hypothetical protein conserved [Leishmania donovani]VDZ48799.1 hypothetical_protein_conserved [Leishmania donovani]
MFRCEEATFYAGVALLCGVVALFAVTRAFLYALGVLVSHVVRDGCFPPLLEHSVCAAALITAVVLFGNVSALLSWMVLLATVTSGALCWSLRSFRWMGVSSFVFYSIALMHVVGPAFVEEVNLTRLEVSALVQGQRVLIPSLPPPRTADESPSSLSSLPALRIYAYYDKVKIEGSASPLATSTVSAASLRLPLELPPWWTHGVRGVSECNGSVKKCSRGDRITQGAELPFPTHHIIASGDDTQLSHYTCGIDIAASALAGSDSIHLVGRRGAIRHSHVYCIIPGKGADPMRPSATTVSSLVYVRCLRLRENILLHNVTIYWAAYPSSSSSPPTFAEAERRADSSSSAPYAWRSLHVGADSEQTCVEVQAQLQGELGMAVTSSLIECVDEVDMAKLPPSFVAKAPLLVWLGWQLPGYVHRVQDILLFFSSHVAAPASALVVVVCRMSYKAASALGQQCGVWLVQMAPYVKHGAEQVAVFAEGALCGSSARREALIGAEEGAVDARRAVLRAMATPSSGCAAFTRAHATRSAFRAGAQMRTSVVSAVSAAVDGLDLVPGVWSVYAWAWRAEHRVTLWIVAALQNAFCFALCVVLQPIARSLIIAAQDCAALAPKFVVLLRCLGRAISQLRILTYFARCCTFMWALEKRVWHYEWAALELVLTFLVVQCETVACVFAKHTVVGVGWANSLVRHYNATSFSIHIAVTFLQTALLGIAMRNELRMFVVAEQQQAPARNLFSRYMPSSLATWLPPSSFANHVNGFWMLVRAHLVECVRYFLLHAVAALVLIGLSVLPFASKLYALSLRYLFPWLSCQYFLAFFSPDLPAVRRVAVYFVGRMAVAAVLQDTIGDFIYRVLKDLLIAVGLTGGLALLLWGWPQRATLAKQVATAIADSLQTTPMPARVSVTAAADCSDAGLRVAEEAAEDEEARQRDVSVAKQIDLTDAA